MRQRWNRRRGEEAVVIGGTGEGEGVFEGDDGVVEAEGLGGGPGTGVQSVVLSGQSALDSWNFKSLTILTVANKHTA